MEGGLRMKGRKPKPAAFMSYVHSDDKYGRLTEFCERLSDEVGACIGEDFLIFHDRKDIPWGQNWKKRIDESLDEVTFLIPIITPSFFNSPYCRRELERFLELEKELGRNDLVLPIYYVDCPLLNDEGKRGGDELAQAIADHQYADWRDLRFEPFTSPQVGKTLAQLAVQIRDALDRVQASEKREAPEPDADVTRRQGEGASVSLPQDVESVIERGELRHEPFTSPEVGKTLEKLAVQIRDALERMQTSPKPEVSKPDADTRHQGDGTSVSLPQDVESVIERGELAREPFAKTEPPTRVRDNEPINEVTNFMGIDDVFKFYRTEFVPAYADLVGYIGDKPLQIPIELENAFAHMAQYFNPELDTQNKDKNLAKVYDHLVRATLDCYKLLWVTIYGQLYEIGQAKSKRKLGFNISKTEFRTKFQKLRKLAQEARGIEMASAGLSPITALDKYKGVVKDGYELIDTIDGNKR